MLKFIKFTWALLLAGIFFQLFSSFSPIKGYEGNKKSYKVLACPTIDISTKTIIKPDCGLSNGSITGITITSSGTKKTYTWRDAENDVVGRSLDLVDIPSGTYTLEVSDNSGCSTRVFSPGIAVQNANAITIDVSGVVVGNQNCSSKGTITGVIVTGATTIEWHNTVTGAIVSTSSTSANLTGVDAGSYQLFAYNNTCQLTSKIFNVLSEGFQIPTVLNFQLVQPACAGAGSISVKLNVQPGQPQLRFFFEDSNGLALTAGVILGNIQNPVLFIGDLDGGTYKLVVENSSGCTALLGTYVLPPGGIAILHSQSAVVNDKCDQHIGSVIPVVIGLTPPSKTQRAQYIWTDLSTNKVVATAQELINVGAGAYSLKVIDIFLCTAIDTFTVTNSSPALIPPIATGTTLCLPGAVNIIITNVDTSKIFKLYGALTDSIPLEVNSTGAFYRNVDHTTDFYVSRSNGVCESDRTKVTEVVVADIKIPNTFTPNNDGINDYWDLNGIEKFPGADISIFNRSGQLVFHSVNYPVPFNGKFHGAQLPVGAYYYVIDLKQPICYGKIAGSLTIIR